MAARMRVALAGRDEGTELAERDYVAAGGGRSAACRRELRQPAFSIGSSEAANSVQPASCYPEWRPSAETVVTGVIGQIRAAGANVCAGTNGGSL